MSLELISSMTIELGGLHGLSFFIVAIPERCVLHHYGVVGVIAVVTQV